MIMTKNRLEAFSDGVLAVAITIMVLEIKVPHGDSWANLTSLAPKFISYLLSFIYIGIYWNNHHHMMHTVSKVNGRILWANHHLLFWLTLVSFATGWMGENHFTSTPTFVYGFVLLMCAIAYVILQNEIIKVHGPDSVLKKAIANDWKGRISPAFYIAAMISSFWLPYLSLIFYGAVALIWLIPDTRIEKRLQET